MTLFSLPARRSARVRPYLRAVKRQRIADNHTFGRFAAVMALPRGGHQ